MELKNPKEIVESLIDMFKNKSDDNPIKMKNFYYCLKNLKYIVFLAEDNKVFWQIDKYKTEEDRIYATIFVDENVFSNWKNGQDINYKIIDFNGLVQLLNSTYTVNNTSAIVVALLSLDDEFIHFKLDIDDINEFQNYVLIYNAISEKNPYIVGAPKDKHEIFLERLKKEFKNESMITNAFFAQVLSPQRDDLKTIESHKENTSYFTIVYDTFDDEFSFSKCLEFQDKYIEMAKEYGVELLIVHKQSQVGSTVTPSKENTFYNTNKLK